MQLSNLKPDVNISELLKTDLNKGFRLVVEKYSSKLYWHIRRLVILHEDADDALQNTFINAWKSIGNLSHMKNSVNHKKRILIEPEIIIRMNFLT